MSEKDSISCHNANKGHRGHGSGGRGCGFFSRRHDFYESPGNFEFEPNWTEFIDDFDQMGLKKELLHGIFASGFKHPSEIQSLSIKPILLGRSVVVKSPIRTGKTVASTIGLFQSIKIEERTTQALVLTPDDISSHQTYELFKNIDKRMNKLHVSIIKEWESNQHQNEEAAKNSHVVIMTPKTALKLMKKGLLQCENMKIACLDEADFILNDEGIDQIKEIFGFIKPEIQILMFAYKITPQIIDIMNNMMHDPVKIVAKKESFLLEKVRQFFINADLDKFKFITLFDIYGQISCQKSIIFANKKETVDFLQRKFDEANFEVSVIHDGLEQKEIEENIMQFIKGKSRVLISTDNLLTFVHVPQITCIINFELPDSFEQYFDRLRPACRYADKGIVINICNTNERMKLNDIQKYFNTRIEELPADFAEILKDARSS